VLLQSERQRREFQQALGAGANRLGALAESLGLRHKCIDTTTDPIAAVSGLLGVARMRR
jgi:hypothetical protein